jgi:ParE toxin of type II toxin-antitoxin system, parDE
MAAVVVAPAALRDLERLIDSRSLPASTRARVVATFEALRLFPERGAPLSGRWSGFRYVLGPWPWLLVVYAYDSTTDSVQIVTLQDARSAVAAIANP